jgi:hypothetical protein
VLAGDVAQELGLLAVGGDGEAALERIELLVFPTEQRLSISAF